MMKKQLQLQPQQTEVRQRQTTTQQSGIRQLVENMQGRQTLTMLMDQVAAYQRDAATTRERLDLHFDQEYGIEGLTKAIDTHFAVQNDEVQLCMGRQIPTFTVEAVSLHLLQQWINQGGMANAKATPISFTRDCFGGHSYKDALIKVRTLQYKGKRERKMLVGVHSTPLINKQNRKGMTTQCPILSTLKVEPGTYWGEEFSEGTSLVDCHYRMRERVLGDDAPVRYDFAQYFQDCLYSCIQSGRGANPNYVFANYGGRDCKVCAADFERFDGTDSIRPNAFWYYKMYLSLFTTGERILVASLDDDDDVEEMFSVFAAIEAVCGKIPLILWIPYKSDYHNKIKEVHFNEVNPACLQDGWRDRIELPSTDSNAYNAMHKIEHTLLHDLLPLD